MTMTLRSTAFSHEGRIPSRYTCEGANTSPPLSVAGVPEGTKTLALTVGDPDAPDPAAPKMTWVHWVLYDLPGDTQELPEAATARDLKARSGINDWKRQGYGGPCPPVGRHRYFFKLYALDTAFGDLGAVNKAALEAKLKGHILAEATLMGTYQKGDK